MRVRSGVVGLSLMLLSALAASSANTRTAEARSSSTAAFGETDADRAPQPDVATVFTAEAEAEADAAPEPSGELMHPALMEKIVTKVMEHNGLKRGGPAGDVAAKPAAEGGKHESKPEAAKPGKGEAGAGPAAVDAKSPNGTPAGAAKRPPNVRPS